MENINRVNLFLIGINKAGSSWLYYVLKEHPDIFMSEVKELYYFGEQYPHRLEKYHSNFDFKNNFHYYGEGTPMYYRKESIAKEIFDYSPSAKIIAVVRDPIERMYSQFYYHKQLGQVEEKTTIEEAFKRKDTHLLQDSHYEKTLPKFENIFGKKNFRIVSLEEMIQNRKNIWRDLQNFLNLEEVNFPENRKKSENATGSPAFRKIYRSTIRPIKKNNPTLYKKLLKSKTLRLTKKMLLNKLGKSQKEALKRATRKRLYEEFEPTYQYLATMGFGDIYKRKK